MVKTCNKCLYGLRGIENLTACEYCRNYSEFKKDTALRNLLYKAQVKIIHVRGVRVEAYKTKQRREDIQLILGSTVLAVMAIVICLLLAKMWGL